jgi:hypothetical protein
MAKVLKDIFVTGSDEIVQGYSINSWHVSQSVDALTGQEAYDIAISGSLEVIGPVTITGSINADPFDLGTYISTDKILFINSTTGEFTVGSQLDQATVLSASYALTSSYAELVQDLTSNQNVGGISSGDTFASGSSIEALLRALLISYIEPTISSLVIRLDGSSISTAARDVGNSFTCNTSSFSATVDSPDGNFPVTASITASGADIGTQQIFLSNTLAGSNVFSLGSTLTINRASSAGSVSFTVNTKSQTTADTQSTSTSFSFLYRNYLAASSTVIFDDTTAQSVINTGIVTDQLDTNRSWTATCTSANTNVSNFTYIIYPATYGDLTSVIQDGSFQVLPAFTKIGDFNITNSFSAVASFRVYKSTIPGAYQPGATLTIS